MDGDELLAFLQTRRSVRDFAPGAIERDRLERLLEAARTAPSATNRQPWRFVVVTSPRRRAELARAVELRAARLKQLIEASPHAAELGSYTDFFHEPIARAAAVVVPAYRELPDLLGALVTRAGGDPADFNTLRAARSEHLSAAAATMNLCLMAHADGLGACWMAGPLIAADEIEQIAELHPPWRALGVVALGRRVESAAATAPVGRKSLENLTRFLED